MPIQLTICRLCIRSRPDVFNTVAQLSAAFPDHLLVVELECMAACDDVPAVMIETDYFPQVAPCRLDALIRERIAPFDQAA